MLNAHGKVIALALAAGGLASVAQAQTNLNTLYATNNSGNAGGAVFFNVVTGATPVTITGFDMNTLATANTVFGFACYTHAGTHVGTETSAAAWGAPVTLGKGVAAGTNLHSVVTIENAIVLAANTTTAFCLVMPAQASPSVAAVHGYTGTAATPPAVLSYSDGTLTINLGSAANVPFAATAPFTPRVWNGTIRYDATSTALGACCVPNPFTQCLQTTAAGCAAQGGTFSGVGVSCATANCPPPPTGACCLTNGNCQVLTQLDCSIAGGIYSGNNVTCGAAGCAPGGACCFYLANSCQTLTQAACTAQAGTWTSAGTACAAANCPLPPAGGDVYAFWANNAARPILSWPVNAPSFNTVIPGVTPVIQTFAIDFAGNNNTLYCITNAAVGSQALGSIDVTTGAYTQIGLISGAGAAEANWAGLAWDASTNTMFALAAANLYTVNLTNGVTTLVAPITGLTGGLLIDFSVNQTGTQMIAHDIGTDRMFSINKVTGAATPLPSVTGFAANFAQGMDFDPVSGNLFATIFTGVGAGAFCKVDTTTGACQILANTGAWAPPNGPEFEMAIKGAPGVACYANCDGSTGTPALTANDFQCFINKYAANEAYANCDGSTGTPALTANDFQCFINKYAGGCS